MRKGAENNLTKLMMFLFLVGYK